MTPPGERQGPPGLPGGVSSRDGDPAPWTNLREGCMAPALPSPARSSGAERAAPTLTRPPFPPPSVVPSVMASGVTGSVSVALHPLVILNISDHWIRMRSQEGRPMQGACWASISNLLSLVTCPK